MKVAVIIGSSRNKGNTATLASSFSSHIKGDVFNLNDFHILPFDYEYTNKGDDFLPLIQQLLTYDCLVFSTPVYWYSPSAQMKTFLDRLSDLLTCHKDLGRKLREKSAAVIATGYDKNPPSCFEDMFRLSFKYLGMNYKSMLYGDCPEAFDPLLAINQKRIQQFSLNFT